MNELEAKAAELKAKKADLQRRRQQLADGGKPTRLCDKMISSVHRQMNDVIRRIHPFESPEAKAS